VTRGATVAGLAVALLALSVVSVPAAALAHPSDDEATAEQIDPELAAGKAAIAAKDWSAAVRLLSSVALRDTRNADVQNYLGYAYRKANQLEPAFRHYLRALQLNPRHRGAHEYIGEAYLLADQPAKAEEHLAALEKICLLPCDEYEDLKNEIAAYRRRVTK